jgi:hypothetical protein
MVKLPKSRQASGTMVKLPKGKPAGKPIPKQKGQTTGTGQMVKLPKKKK